MDALIVEAVGSIMPICSVPPGAAPTPSGSGGVKSTDPPEKVRGEARGNGFPTKHVRIGPRQ